MDHHHPSRLDEKLHNRIVGKANNINNNSMDLEIVGSGVGPGGLADDGVSSKQNQSLINQSIGSFLNDS
jgi:hypothetical protein